MKIPFNKPFIFDEAIDYIKDSINRSHIAGDGYYTKLCNKWLEENLGCKKALLTHSCTAALEMSAILLDIQAGDEIIMPSFTFVSTANAFVLRGGVPVFVDIRPDTLNIDENLIEQAITEKTKAIVVVHYSGVACEMDKIMAIAQKYNLAIVEDAAQSIMAKYKGKYLGTFGDFATISFHETKNIISGEGGALLINNDKYIERAEIIREKGTNRSKFFRGELDKYTWVDIGSSFLPSELISAFLYSQLEKAQEINKNRKQTWDFYHNLFKKYEKRGGVRRPIIPDDCDFNAHIYYILFNSLDMRTKFIQHCKNNEISPVFHYIPLHSSPAGKEFAKIASKMEITDTVTDTLVRLPLYYNLTDTEKEKLTNVVINFFEQSYINSQNLVSFT